jgi:hypothetical protein
MLQEAWNSALRWAAEARAQQAKARSHARWALAIAALAAILAAVVASVDAPRLDAAAAEAVGAAGATGGGSTAIALSWHWTSAVSMLAGLMAAFAAIFGRHILDSRAEAVWVAARAAAEATRSECYRYAGGAAPYAAGGAAAAETFEQIRKGIAESARARGALNLGKGSDNPDRKQPPMGMTAAWYRSERLEKQKQWYETRSVEHQRKADRLRLVSLLFGLAAAALGILGSLQGLSFLTAGVGAVTTIAASFAAYSSLERQSYLANSYAGMVDAIGSLLGRHAEQLLTDQQLIEEGETLLAAEYRAWADRMSKPAKGDG